MASDQPEGIFLPRQVAERVLDHARASMPNEACGILSGSLHDRRVTGFHPARNVDASPLRFTLHPEDQVRITFAIERAGEELVAIFHSHPRSPAVPSPTDRRGATYPEAFHLLASLSDPNTAPDRCLRAWRIQGGSVREVPVVVG